MRISDHHSELLREAHIALDHVAHVVHLVAELQGALDAHAEARVGWTLDPRSALRLEASYTFRQLTPPWSRTETAHLFRFGLVCHFRERHTEQVARYVLH